MGQVELIRSKVEPVRGLAYMDWRKTAGGVVGTVEHKSLAGDPTRVRVRDLRARLEAKAKLTEDERGLGEWFLDDMILGGMVPQTMLWARGFKLGKRDREVPGFKQNKTYHELEPIAGRLGDTINGKFARGKAEPTKRGRYRYYALVKDPRMLVVDVAHVLAGPFWEGMVDDLFVHADTADEVEAYLALRHSVKSECVLGARRRVKCLACWAVFTIACKKDADRGAQLHAAYEEHRVKSPKCLAPEPDQLGRAACFQINLNRMGR